MSILKRLDHRLLGRARPDLIVLTQEDWEAAVRAVTATGSLYRNSLGELRYRGVPIITMPMTRSFAIVGPDDIRIDYL